MPVAMSAVNVATFDQLEGEDCCICNQHFEEVQDELIQRGSPFRFHSFRVVFPSVCNERHFVHVNCYHGKVADGDLTDAYLCPKPLCNRNVGVKANILKSLDAWMDIGDACRPVIEVLESGQDGKLDYEKISTLQGKADVLVKTIEDYPKALDVKKLYVEAYMVIGNSYLSQSPEAEGDIDCAIDAFKKAMIYDPDASKEGFEKIGLKLLRSALDTPECNLECCFKKVEDIHALYPQNEKLSDLLAQMHLQKAKMFLDAIGDRVYGVGCVENSKKFYDQHRLLSFNRTLENMCLDRCHLLMGLSSDKAVDFLVSYFPVLRKMDSCFSTCEELKGILFKMAMLHLEKTESCFKDVEFIDFDVLSEMFCNLNFCRVYGKKQAKNRVGSLEKAYFALMGAKLNAVLKEAREIEQNNTGANPFEHGKLSAWLDIIKNNGNRSQKRELARLTNTYGVPRSGNNYSL